MSWTDELYKVYEQQCNNEKMGEIVLLPVAHSTANAQIEVTLKADGTFVSATALSKEDGLNTIIPVTEDSGGRTSGVCAMPLADKLIYIAGDYSNYVGGKKSDNSAYFKAYIEQLERWKNSSHSHPSVNAIYSYLTQKMLMKDLVDEHILRVNEETGLLEDKVNIAGIAQADCFVRFRVYGGVSETWLDKSLYDSFIAWNNEEMADVDLCYATGKTEAVTYKHPSKIRNTGDKSKLISANDESGFTYRGRFSDKTEAISVSYDFSQKMHNALRWLIQRQGISISETGKKRESMLFDTLQLVVWTSSLEETHNLIGCAYDEDDDEFFGEEIIVPDTEVKYRDFLRKSIFGTKNFDIDSKVMLMGVDAATTGRLSISIYEELEHSRLLEQLIKWHSETGALRYYSKHQTSGINSFAVREIINCAYGMENGKGFLETKPEIVKENVLRLLPCITQGRAIPADIVHNLVKKASNPLAYEHGYNHRKVIETACGMIRRQNFDRKRGIISMAYDPNEKDRSYLFGCLLAIADAAEYAAYDENDKKSRITNAKRYWSMFAKRPFTTWAIIEKQVRIYMTKLDKKKRDFYEREFNSVMDKFILTEFSDNNSLTSAYLLGYHHYNHKLKDFKKTEEE